MSFALSALLILLLVLPGIVFRKSYLRGGFKRPLGNSSPSEDAARGAIFALIIHLLACYSLGIESQGVGDVFALLVGDETAVGDDFSSFWPGMAYYLVGVTFAASVAGRKGNATAYRTTTIGTT